MLALPIIEGKQPQAQRVGVHGVEGVGKTELAATLSKPLFIDVEHGTSHINVARVEPTTMGEINSMVEFLTNDDHDYENVILDTIDWVEKRMAQDLCRRYNVDSIEKIEGGYGKGYTMLEEEMMTFLNSLDNLRKKRGVNIVLLAHTKVQKYEDPELAASYDRYQLKLEKKTSALIKEWVDALLFYNFVTKIADREGTMNSKRGVQGTARSIRTCRTAAYDAKNRSDLPMDIPVTERHVLPKELVPLFEHAGASNAHKVETAPATPNTTPPVPRNQEDGADDIPGLPATESWNDKMNAIVKECGGEKAVDAFLATRQKTLSTADKAYCMRIIENKAQFIDQVKAFNKGGAGA